MTIFSKLLVGAAGVGMVAVATPAAAQYYPQQQPYGQPYGGQGGVIGQVLNQVLGGGRYGAYGQGNDRIAVDQCARAVEARVSHDNRRGVYGAWNQRGYQGYGNQGYGNNGYSQSYGQAQVVGITGVQRIRSGLRVTGLIDTRMGLHRGYGGQYGQYGQYGQAYPAYPNQGYGYPNQGYAYPNQAHPNQAYPQPGYGQPGYGQQAYDPRHADLRFSCRVDSRGRVSDLDIRRINGRRGV